MSFICVQECVYVLQLGRHVTHRVRKSRDRNVWVLTERTDIYHQSLTCSEKKNLKPKSQKNIVSENNRH